MAMTMTKYQSEVLVGMLVVLLSVFPGNSLAESPSDDGTVRVAGIVLKWLRTNKAGNYRRLEPMVREADRQGA